MAKGGRLTNRRRGKEQPSSTRVEKQKGQASGAHKPMELDDKMAVSLDDIIKRDKEAAKRGPSLNKKRDSKKAGPNSNDKNNKGSSKQRPPKSLQRQQSSRNATNNNRFDSQKGGHDLRITVNSRMIKDRPILNQIISNAELNESQRISRNLSSRLQERVQPVSLDYRMAPDGRSKDYALVERNSYRPPHSLHPHQGRAPPSPAPMHIDSYYRDNLGDYHHHQYSSNNNNTMRRHY